MGYSDQKFYARPLVLAAESINGTATATASDHVVTNTLVERLVEFDRRTQVNAAKIIVTTAPNAGAVGTTMALLNGTATFATITVGTNTAGEYLEATVTAANAIFSADTAPTVNLISTATASENTDQGTYKLWLEQQELFA